MFHSLTDYGVIYERHFAQMEAQRPEELFVKLIEEYGEVVHALTTCRREGNPGNSASVISRNIDLAMELGDLLYYHMQYESVIKRDYDGGPHAIKQFLCDFDEWYNLDTADKFSAAFNDLLSELFRLYAAVLDYLAAHDGGFSIQSVLNMNIVKLRTPRGPKKI